MLPVMILTLIAVLEGIRILPGAFWAAGAALVIASAWTTFRIQATVAEICIDGPLVAARTVWEVVNDVEVRREQVLDVRDYGRWMHVTIGLTTYDLDREYWPEYTRLVAALRNCAASRRPEG